MRSAKIFRKTNETQIELELNLDGSGEYFVKNPIGFFDHMLHAFCKHGLFDLKGEIRGDLNVDQHHTIEDAGIVLGQCFLKALGDCNGIFRSGFFVFPMDESLLSAAVDFGGRAFCFVDAKLSDAPLISISDDENGKKIESSFQVDCIYDFWQGFSSGAKCNIHLETLRGRSDHHKIEGLFKVASRAIRSAIEIDPRRKNEIPSTKGVIV